MYLLRAGVGSHVDFQIARRSGTPSWPDRQAFGNHIWEPLAEFGSRPPSVVSRETEAARPSGSSALRESARRRRVRMPSMAMEGGPVDQRQSRSHHDA